MTISNVFLVTNQKIKFPTTKFYIIILDKYCGSIIIITIVKIIFGAIMMLFLFGVLTLGKIILSVKISTFPNILLKITPRYIHKIINTNS